MNLAGQSKEQIEKALEHKRRGELIEIIYRLASFEPMFSPEEVARRRDIAPRTILRLVKEGRLQAHKVGHKTVRIPLSSLSEWDQKTKV